MRSLALVSAMMAVATASAGCAVIAAKAPDPERPSGTPPMCNDGKGGVAVDGLMATALGVATLALAADGEGEAGAIVGLGALAYGLSAAAGNSSANKCRAAMEAYVASRERTEAEAAFARNGGGSIGGVEIAPDEEDAPAASIPPPPPPPPPRPVPPPAPVTQVQPQPQPAPRPTPVTRPASPAVGGDDGDWSEFWKEVP